MNQDAYQALLRLETTPQALQASCDYLAEKLRGFLSAQEPVLICFPDEGEDSVGGMFGKVVRSCGAEPLLVYWRCDPSGGGCDPDQALPQDL